MRPTPDASVVRWLDEQNELDLWVSAITLAEIFLGIESLPNGKRKTGLYEAACQIFTEDFHERWLPFDSMAARQYARIIADSKCRGTPVSVEDAQIAAIAITGDLVLATRNIRDFRKIPGIKLFNPWE